MPKSNTIFNKKADKIYLDYTASVSPNPSSIHKVGVEAKRKLDNARESVARVLGARPRDIIFTSGGTESNNLAIQGVIYAAQEKNFSLVPHIVTTNIEHPSVLETCRLLEKRRLAQVSYVEVESNGIVNPKKIKKAIRKNTVLVSVMYVNNEIGTIQPLRGIAKEIRHYKKQNKRNNIFFHTDAVQAVNYLDLNIEKLGVDLLSVSGSKIQDASKIGFLYRRVSVPLSPIFGGGDQEMGLRPGTESLFEILKFVPAFEAVQKVKAKEAKRLLTLRNYFLEKLKSVPAPFIINGDLKERMPNNINITFPKIPSDLLVIELSAKGIMASSKSACKSKQEEGSYVIKAIRRESDPEIGGLRFSLGGETTKTDIDKTISALHHILTKLKKWYY